MKTILALIAEEALIAAAVLIKKWLEKRRQS
jgi:hypothetical protein